MTAARGSFKKRLAVLMLAAAMLVSSLGAVSVSAANTSTESETEESTGASTAKKKDYLKGFVTKNGKTYYYKYGEKCTGKKYIAGNWYYFKKNGVMARKEFITVRTNSGKKKTCYYDKNGHVVYGAQKIGKYNYYFNEVTGAMKTGWRTVGTKRYYYNKKGRMVTGITKTINGTKYQFNDRGVLMLGNPDNNAKANEYSSPTKYLIMVNRNLHKVSIYTGSKGSWRCIKYWPCVVGQINMQSPAGVHHITGFKGRYFDSHGLRWWYFTCYYSNTHHFHSQGYKQESEPRTVINGEMGVSGSAGCIRLYLENAYWLQKHMPAGTTCVVYN